MEVLVTAMLFPRDNATNGCMPRYYNGVVLTSTWLRDGKLDCLGVFVIVRTVVHEHIQGKSILGMRETTMNTHNKVGMDPPIRNMEKRRTNPKKSTVYTILTAPMARCAKDARWLLASFVARPNGSRLTTGGSTVLRRDMYMTSNVDVKLGHLEMFVSKTSTSRFRRALVVAHPG